MMTISILILAVIGLFAIIFSGGVLTIALCKAILAAIDSRRKPKLPAKKLSLAEMATYFNAHNELLDDLPYAGVDPAKPGEDKTVETRISGGMPLRSKSK